jgi:hypothetical protein
MKNRRVFLILLLCLVTIVSSLGFVGCGDDSDQIRSVITKFYKTRANLSYVERWNSHLCTPSYHSDVGVYGALVIIASQDAKKVEVKFSDIDVREDFATAEYSVYVTERDGNERSASFTTKMVEDDGKWKMSFTRSEY